MNDIVAWRGESEMLLKVKKSLNNPQRRAARNSDITRVVVADDHAVVRQGLKRLLNQAAGIEVVGEASDGLQAIHCVSELDPDVLLLDIEMPGMDGVEVARTLYGAAYDVRILVLSAYDDREYIRALLEIGVAGYLVKGEAPDRIVEAVRGVAKGQRMWVSPQVRKKLEMMKALAHKQDTLTSRDLLLLKVLAAGKDENEIIAQMNMKNADELDAAIQTVVEKVGAQTSEQAVEIALQEGWVVRP